MGWPQTCRTKTNQFYPPTCNHRSRNIIFYFSQCSLLTSVIIPILSVERRIIVAVDVILSCSSHSSPSAPTAFPMCHHSFQHPLTKSVYAKTRHYRLLIRQRTISKLIIRRILSTLQAIIWWKCAISSFPTFQDSSYNAALSVTQKPIPYCTPEMQSLASHRTFLYVSSKYSNRIYNALCTF